MLMLSTLVLFESFWVLWFLSNHLPSQLRAQMALTVTLIPACEVVPPSFAPRPAREVEDACLGNICGRKCAQYTAVCKEDLFVDIYSRSHRWAMPIYHSIRPNTWPSLLLPWNTMWLQPNMHFFTTNPIVLSVGKDGIHQFGSVFSFGTFSFDKQLGHMWGFRALQLRTNNIIMRTLAASVNKLCGHIGSHSMTKRIFEYRMWEGHRNVQMEGFPDTSILKQHMHLAIHCFRSPLHQLHELSLTKPRIHHSPLASGNSTSNIKKPMKALDLPAIYTGLGSQISSASTKT